MVRAWRAIRLRTLLFGATAVVALGAPACVAPSPGRPPTPEGSPGSSHPASEPESNPARVAGELVEAHQRIRDAHHLPALSLSAPLQAAADRHARDMARRHRMSHRGGDGSSPFDRM